MRGTLARKLRKEAQGNEALYDVEKEVSDPWFDVISQKVLQSVVYISTMPEPLVVVISINSLRSNLRINRGDKR